MNPSVLVQGILKIFFFHQYIQYIAKHFNKEIISQFCKYFYRLILQATAVKGEIYKVGSGLFV